MIAFREMVVEAAKQAGIKVPENLYEYKKNEYPHWHVYCNLQVGTPIPEWGCHWENAKVIAGISEEEIRTLTIDQIIERGFMA